MAKYYRGTKVKTTERFGDEGELLGREVVTEEYDLDAVDNLAEVDDPEEECDGDCESCCASKEDEEPVAGVVSLHTVIGKLLGIPDAELAKTEAERAATAISKATVAEVVKQILIMGPEYVFRNQGLQGKDHAEALTEAFIKYFNLSGFKVVD